MAAFVEVSNKSLTACNVTPTGDAGLAINNNFASIDALFNLVLGQNAMRPRGNWLTATAYIIGDLVLSSGIFYQCVLGHTSSGGNTPPNGTYWNVVTGGLTAVTAVTSGNGLTLSGGTLSFSGAGYDSAGAAAAAQAASLPIGGGTLTGSLNLGSHTITNSPTLTAIKGISITGQSTIATGTIGSVQIPFNSTVTGWTVVSTDGTSGSVSFDLQTCALGSGVYTSTPANSIIGTTGSPVKPNLTSQITNSSTSFTNWTTTSLSAGNYLVFVVTGTPAAVMNVRVELKVAPR